MRWPDKISHRLRSIFAKARADAELSRELQFHLQQQIEEFIARGMSAPEARNAALRELGGLEQIKEQCRESRRVNWIEHTLQDVRFALRACRKNPGFTSVVVLTLALGIGANTAIFSLVNGILLQPLPYPHPEQLVNASYTGPVPKGAFLGFQEQLKSMEIAAYTWSGFNVSSEGNSVRINGTEVSSNFFTLLGVLPLQGRVFRQGDELPGQDHLAIISYGLWQRRFGSDPQIVGRWMNVDDTARQIVGVMPRDFSFPAPSIEMWVPASADAQRMWKGFLFWMVGRIKPGVDLAGARAEFKTAAPQVVAHYPWQMGKNYTPAFNIGPLQHDSVGRVRPTLLLLLGAVALILLVACVNVANLLLGKSAVRQKEIAVRTVLGASRRRIVRQLLTESTLLALAGGAVGVLFAFGSLDLLKSFLPAYTPRLADVHIDGRVMGFSLIVSLLTGLVFGIAPALHASITGVEQSLKAGAQTASIGRKSKRLSSALVVAEVALAVLLVSGAGLLIKSVYVLMQSTTGVQSDQLLTAHITPASSFCRKNNDCRNFYSQVLEQVRTIPGVKDAAVSDGIPLYNVGRTVVAVEDRPEFSPENPYSTWEFSVSPDYLPTMGIPVLRGRNFDNSDTAQSAKVVLIEKKLADFFWPGQDPIGKQIKPSWMKEWRTVIGVVQDVHAYTISPDDVAARMIGAVYFPEAQGIVSPPGEMDLVVRTEGDPLATARYLPQAVAKVNPNVPASRIRTMDEIIHLSIAAPRSTMWLFTAFASLALLLGVVGIYSVLSYAVAQRTREIGIRMALGAERWEVMGLLLRQGSYLTVMGLAIGVGSALALTRFMASLLHGVQPKDPLTLALVSGLVGSASITACLIPSRRATRVDPTVALKYE